MTRFYSIFIVLAILLMAQSVSADYTVENCKKLKEDMDIGNCMKLHVGGFGLMYPKDPEASYISVSAFQNRWSITLTVYGAHPPEIDFSNLRELLNITGNGCELCFVAHSVLFKGNKFGGQYTDGVYFCESDFKPKSQVDDANGVVNTASVKVPPDSILDSYGSQGIEGTGDYGVMLYDFDLVTNGKCQAGEPNCCDATAQLCEDKGNVCPIILLPKEIKISKGKLDYEF